MEHAVRPVIQRENVVHVRAQVPIRHEGERSRWSVARSCGWHFEKSMVFPCEAARGSGLKPTNLKSQLLKRTRSTWR